MRSAADGELRTANGEGCVGRGSPSAPNRGSPCDDCGAAVQRRSIEARQTAFSNIADYARICGRRLLCAPSALPLSSFVNTLRGSSLFARFIVSVALRSSFEAVLRIASPFCGDRSKVSASPLQTLRATIKVGRQSLCFSAAASVYNFLCFSEKDVYFVALALALIDCRC
jgi:hypothetical protein